MKNSQNYKSAKNISKQFIKQRLNKIWRKIYKINILLYSNEHEYILNKIRNYPDILLVPRDNSKGYKAVMVEFKYIKKGEVAKLEDKQKEAREQIERYSSFEDIKDIKDIQGLRKYTLVVSTNDIYVEEIV